MFCCLIVAMADELKPSDELKPDVVKTIDLKPNIDQPEVSDPSLHNIPQVEVHVIDTSAQFATNKKYKDEIN
jgi:hypothetical protein